MPKEEITTDVLARMVKDGFDATAKKQDVDDQFTAVNHRFDDVEHRLDHIEHRLILAQTNRLERLEDDMRLVKTKLAIT